MSVFGTAGVIDVASTGDVNVVLAALEDADAYFRTLPGGWSRVTVALEETDQVTAIAALLARAGTARAAVAEDNDEYGALWVVLSAIDGAVSTVHRRYVLNADPDDPTDLALALQDFDGADPRADDVAGSDAAAEAARLFEVSPKPMITAESRAGRAHEDLGVVGGPFPWWAALGLTWPGPRAGEPLPPPAPSKASQTATRPQSTPPKQWARKVAPQLTSVLPGEWTADGNLLKSRVNEHLAWYIIRSGPSGGHYTFTAVVRPLYVLSDIMDVTLGTLVGHGVPGVTHSFAPHAPDQAPVQELRDLLVRFAVPYFEDYGRDLESYVRYAETIASKWPAGRGPWSIQAGLAGAYALLGDWKRAKATWQNCLLIFDTFFDHDFQPELRELALQRIEAIDQTAQETVISQLRQNEIEMSRFWNLPDA